jgi:hypothetical protein
MPAQHETQKPGSGRIVLFPSRLPIGKGRPRQDVSRPEVQGHGIENLRKYERGVEPDDYRRRMTINAMAFAFIVVLTLAGVWLAEQFAMLQKAQDCAFSGRKNCAGINVRIRDH